MCPTVMTDWCLLSWIVTWYDATIGVETSQCNVSAMMITKYYFSQEQVNENCFQYQNIFYAPLCLLLRNELFTEATNPDQMFHKLSPMSNKDPYHSQYSSHSQMQISDLWILGNIKNIFTLTSGPLPSIIRCSFLLCHNKVLQSKESVIIGSLSHLSLVYCSPLSRLLPAN